LKIAARFIKHIQKKGLVLTDQAKAQVRKVSDCGPTSSRSRNTHLHRRKFVLGSSRTAGTRKTYPVMAVHGLEDGCTITNILIPFERSGLQFAARMG
jgi:hypothetical protein